MAYGGNEKPILLQNVGNQAFFNILADEIAEQPAEIFMTGKAHKAARVG